MHFDFRKDAPLTYECPNFLRKDLLTLHRDTYMGKQSAALAIYTDGKDGNGDAEALYRMSHSSFPVPNRFKHKEMSDDAGGYFAHRCFFNSIGNGILNESGKNKLRNNFGSPDEFGFKFKVAADTTRESGFLWLYEEKARRGKLGIVFTRKNRLLPPHLKPILCLDLWEHSYVSVYGDDKKTYATAFLQNADWSRL